jgi:hypothetical protein
MFMPKQGLTRAQFFVAMVRMLEGDKSEDVNPWYGNYFAAAQRLGLTKETDVFAQDRFITRYEAALILYRARNTNEAEVCEFDPSLIDGDQDLWDWLEDLFGNWSDSTTTDGGVVTQPTSAGTLSVSLDATSPAGGNVAGNTSVAVAAYKFSATTEDVALNTITLQRFGLSSNDAVTRVELVVDGQVVGRDRSLNSDGKAVFSFSRPVVVPAGKSVIVHAVATVWNATAVSNQRFHLAVVDFNSNGTNNKSNLPVRGNEFVVAGVNGAWVTVSADGVVSNKRLGATGAEVAKFRIRNDANTEDVFVTAITLRDLENNADDNLRNLKLRTSNWTIIATVDSVSANNNGAFTFTLTTPLEIKRGQTQRFNVVADIVDWAGDNINIVVERSSNVRGYSSQLGLGLAATINAFNNANMFTITAGELTISKNALAATKMTKNRDNFVLASWDFIVAPGQNLALEDIDLHMELEWVAAAVSLSSQFRNISLRVNWVLSDLDVNEVTNGLLVRLSETNMWFSLPAWQSSKVELVVDTVNSFNAAFLNRYVRVGLSADPARLKIEETNDGRRVTSITPSVSQSDRVQIVDVAVSILPVSLSNTNAVVGSENVVAGDFQVRTTDAGPAELQSLTLEWNVNFASSRVSAVKLWRRVAGVNNWELVDSKGWFDIVNNRVSFDNFGEVVIPTSSTQDMRVTIDIVNNTANNGNVVGPLRVISAGTNVFDADNNNVDIQWAGVNESSLWRTITLQGQGTLAVSVRNNDTLTNQPKSVVAGATSDYVAAFEFVATNEAILVEDLNVVAVGNNFSNRVSALELYAMSGNQAVLVASESTVGGNSTQFNNVNITMPQWSTRLYLKAVTRRYGQASGGADVTTTEAPNDALTFSLEVTTARGVSSSEDVTAAVTAASNAMFIYPVRISNVSFVTSAEGVTIGNTSAGNGENIAILRVTADNWNNTDTANGTLLTAILEEITLRSSSANLTNLTVERLGVGNNTQVIGANVGAVYSFDLASAPAVVNELDRQQVAFFLVRGDLLPQANNYSVRVSLEDLNNGDIEYSHDGTNADTVTALNIGVTRLESNSITVLQ